MAPFVLFEPHGDPARIAPTQPLGAWAQGPLRRLLEATERERPVLLDLSRSPLETPQQVAAVLWADDVAADLGVRLEVLAGDMPSAEILDFAGLQAPVYSAFSVLPSPGRSASSARRARMRARRA